MSQNGYRIFSLDDASWSTKDTTESRVSVTDDLECAETHIDYYRTAKGKPIELQQDREALSIPLNGSGVITLERPVAVPRLAVTCKLAGTSAKLHSGTETIWIVVSTIPETTNDETLTTLPSELFDFVTPTTSDIETAHLSEPLGCQGVKANIRRLQPGQTIPYHKEPTQEELYVPLDGPGQVRIAGTTHKLQQGDIVKIDPAVPRAAVNEGDQQRMWLMIGAPPTGGPNEWDPDAEYADWSDTE